MAWLGTRAAKRLMIVFLCAIVGQLTVLTPRQHLAHAQSSRAISQRVDLVLVLAIDCSWSVDGGEYRLQVEGMSRAFRDPAILQAIQEGRLKRIAVTAVQWAGNTQQIVTMPWQVIESKSDALAVAEYVDAMPRHVSQGSTSITTVLKFAAKVIVDAPFKFERAVIDVATDGRNNTGGDPRPVRDLLGDVGITVNGLTILNEFPTLNYYFANNITVGPGHFVVTANSYAGYAKAIRKKILKEIQGPPIS